MELAEWGERERGACCGDGELGGRVGCSLAGDVDLKSSFAVGKATIEVCSAVCLERDVVDHGQY